jgi:hypothetical protein
MKKILVLLTSICLLQNVSAQTEEEEIDNTNSFENAAKTANSFENASNANQADNLTSTNNLDHSTTSTYHHPKKKTAPFDGGLTLVLAAGAFYGIKRARNKRTTELSKNK